MEEIKSSPVASSHDRNKMLGILDRFERQAVNEEQLLNNISDSDLIHHAQQQRQQSDLKASRASTGIGAETGSVPTATSQRKLTPKERKELLRKAIEEEAKEGALPDENDNNINPAEREEMERMIEQEYQDFVSRFAGVDLDQESFESIWERLNPDERREFQEKFMISGHLEEEDDDHIVSVDADMKDDSDNDNEDEEKEARMLLNEMGETLERGRAKVNSNGQEAMAADLDMEDLKAIRNAEIAELIQIWRPWWEIEAEECGQLKKVLVTKVKESDTGKQDAARLKAASNIILQGDTTSTTDGLSSPPHLTTSEGALEKYVLDEEAMLRPHQALVRPVEEIEKEVQQRAQSSVSPMTKAPHPSLIYHVSALLFAYAATIRIFNGDLQEEPEQVLAHIFELCPFFAPTPSPPSSTSESGPGPSSKTIPGAIQQPQAEDFETTLAFIQASSLNSKLWKGDTARLDMLSLLLRDLTLILARPSRCLHCIKDLKVVFQTCIQFATKPNRRQKPLFSKTTLHRLSKKLEFYESYLLSEEWFLKSDRLDQVRTEIVMTGMRVRQEMIGWNREMEQVSRVAGDVASQGNLAASSTTGMTVSDDSKHVKAKKVLIEEL
ncbi:hypothetical protein FBU30_011042 [Linnemannia zychae]|nr:hypothetical protein FBU30_011042 [Linnemannia zychae]